jgi:hypothetical protein
VEVRFCECLRFGFGMKNSSLGVPSKRHSGRDVYAGAFDRCRIVYIANLGSIAVTFAVLATTSVIKFLANFS